MEMVTCGLTEHDDFMTRAITLLITTPRLSFVITALVHEVGRDSFRFFLS